MKKIIAMIVALMLIVQNIGISVYADTSEENMLMI